jgi:CysZ protein
MIASLLLALRQLPDPAFLAPLLKAGLLAALAFAAAAFGAGWAVEHWLSGPGGQDTWLGSLAAALAGLLVLVGAIWLYLPVVLALTGLFLDSVAAAVERRFYPGLPPAHGASLLAQARFGIGLGVRLLLLNILALPLLLLAPPVGAVTFFLLATVALGHGTFEGVAQRRLSVPAARALRRRYEVEVLTLGAVLAGLAMVPLVNLVVPVLGTAAMTHLLHRRTIAKHSSAVAPSGTNSAR